MPSRKLSHAEAKAAADWVAEQSDLPALGAQSIGNEYTEAGLHHEQHVIGRELVPRLANQRKARTIRECHRVGMVCQLLQVVQAVNRAARVDDSDLVANTNSELPVKYRVMASIDRAKNKSVVPGAAEKQVISSAAAQLYVRAGKLAGGDAVDDDVVTVPAIDGELDEGSQTARNAEAVVAAVHVEDEI